MSRFDLSLNDFEPPENNGGSDGMTFCISYSGLYGHLWRYIVRILGKCRKNKVGNISPYSSVEACAYLAKRLITSGINELNKIKWKLERFQLSVTLPANGQVIVERHMNAELIALMNVIYGFWFIKINGIVKVIMLRSWGTQWTVIWSLYEYSMKWPTYFFAAANIGTQIVVTFTKYRNALIKNNSYEPPTSFKMVLIIIRSWKGF